MEVQSSPTIEPQYSNWGSLDKNSYSVSVVYSHSYEHAWVEVKVPKIGPNGEKKFQTINLDSTVYSDFVPLYPRHSGISDKDRVTIMKGCKSLLTCLVGVRLREVENSGSNVKGSSTH